MGGAESTLNPPMYSIEVPNTATPTSGPIHRNSRIDVPPMLSANGAYTSYENFNLGLSRNPDGPCLGWRDVNQVTGVAGPYRWLTYKQTREQIDQLASGLLELGLLAANEDGLKVFGFYLKNCPEWVVAEQACFASGAVPVPFYDTLGVETVTFCLVQTGTQSVLCTAAELPVLEAVARSGDAPCLRNVIVKGLGTDSARIQAVKQRVGLAGLKAFSFEEVVAVGAAHPHPHTPPSADDICTFCYTSGTTGNPKGALITHRNLISFVAANLAEGGVPVGVDDVHLSYLPLPHIFERIIQCGLINAGAAIGFYQGDTLKILDDLTALQPTLFPSVPRLLNRIHDKVLAGVKEAGGIKEFLFTTAFNAKLARLRTQGAAGLHHPVWDTIVFGPLKRRLGLGRIRAIVSGSAPLSANVMDFLRVVFGCVVVEGYGQTEGAAAATVTDPEDVTTGHVGPPVPVCEIRLEDVPEMGYTQHDREHMDGEKRVPCNGRGEICVRGPNIFAGYYKQPEKTAETVDAEKWCHTGDIGLWTPSGQLRIIDRKKNIFKLAQGEYVAPEKLENIYSQAQLLAAIFVYGDSLQNCLVAIGIPDEETAASWAHDNGKASLNLAALCNDAGFKTAVMKQLKACASKAKLQGFEAIKAIHLDPEPFSPDNGLTTPTFKLKRNVARDHYRARIDAMYATLPNITSKL